MLSFFRKPKKKNLTKNSTFYHRENLIQNIYDLNNVFHVEPSGFDTTNFSITFQGVPLENVNSKLLEEKLGDETYLLDHNDVILGHKIYFYRKNVNKYRLLIQIHFIDNKLFFAATKFSAENLLNNHDKETIINYLLSNYNDVTYKTNQFDYGFTDVKGNKICTTDNVFLYIKYYPSNSDLKQIQQLAENGSYDNISTNLNEDTLDKFI